METTLGIIEGFYGKLYTKRQRESLCSFASRNGYSYYIYAPKNDRSLRRAWKEEFSDTQIAKLKNFALFCHAHSMQFGIGISPLGITEDPKRELSFLYKKIDTAINEFNADIIAILFDDIKLYTKDEGIKQKQIVKDIFNRLKGKRKRLIFCPTYYSFDPILDKVFGERPSDYFEQITDNLPHDIEIFWTGNKVLSKSITREDIENINKRFKRKVTIWDNYPVNDGKFISKKIYTREFSSREKLDGVVLSHAVNPMLEANLTKISLSTLPLCYQEKSETEIREHRLKEIKNLFKSDSSKLIDYLDKLNDEGIDCLNDSQKKELLNICKKKKNAASREIIDFINGVYKFDPACLTS
ncbi:beta-N-acetylglucosaminidase domain-containing protein [Succinivibrio dextrinosolvens]|uniref:Beta-N-acetylglucosaminidase n=1 Tax=Succinivibrio dextrinosolvens TaxID=83771 RepID=A0A662Z8I4_9GAMM|nr:beta-N-acetylglucosaminidase domain-containing protein [Succinivibrio dextrinosolvens]SFK02214.1 beta-N-acetylglucosaminidase [Succinivibrio dextrinosolvens]